MSYPSSDPGDSLPPTRPVGPAPLLRRKPLILTGLVAALIATLALTLYVVGQPTSAPNIAALSAVPNTVTPFPTYPPVPTNTVVPTPSGPPCYNAIPGGTQYFGNLALTAAPALTLGYPHYALPDNIAQKPYALPPYDGATGTYDGWVANVNPVALMYLFTICNTSHSHMSALTNVQVAISGFTAYSGSLNQWGICDGYYSGGQVQGGGCGGAIGGFDAQMRAAFAPAYSPGMVVNATWSGGHTLPLQIAPGQAITVSLTVTAPTTGGTYTFTITAQTADGDIAQTVGSLLLAPVAHQWTGPACTSAAMQSQIPHDTQQYICPNS